MRRCAMMISALLFTLALGVGCGARGDTSLAATAPAESFADHECGTCGMIVREQPSPRAQVVHRDGTHAWFCSMADLVAYLDAPSTHGRIEQVWVETLPADTDPASANLEEHPWAHASEAFFVVGIDRVGVMGTPVLAFATEADADGAAGRLRGHAARWSEVVTMLGGTP